MRQSSIVGFLLVELLLVVLATGFFVARPDARRRRLISVATSNSENGDLSPSLLTSTDVFRDNNVDNILYSENVLKAASSMTRDAYPLLGVKSVGVDYGTVRTGVAATVGFNPKPLEILSDLNNTQLCQRVVEICRAEQAEQVIVGLPLHKNGTEAEQTNLTRIFAAELAHAVLYDLGPECPVYLWDERYTSKEAAARAHSKNPGRFLYGTLDAEAACIILENFYNDNGEKAERVQVSEEALKLYEQIFQQRAEREQAMVRAAMEERDSRLQWRKEAMERDRLLEMSSSGESSSNSKKKKKGKRKR